MGVAVGGVEKSGFATRMKIVRATSALMQDRRLNDISTTEICHEAGVSRPTFYRYFADKFEVPQWHFELIAETYLYEAGRCLSFHDANWLNSLELQKMKHFYIPAFKTSSGCPSTRAAWQTCSTA